MSRTIFQGRFTNEYYRRITLGADAHVSESSKILTTEYTTNEYGNNLSSQQYDVAQEQSPNSSCRSVNVSDPASKVSTGVQGSNSVEGGVRFDISGYVQQSPSFEQTRNPVTVNQRSCRLPGYGQHKLGNIDAVDSLQLESMLGAGQKRIMIPWFFLVCMHTYP